jgi:hypothetical protein
MMDPTYVDDFWFRSGYLGSNPTGSIRAARFHFDTTVAGITAGSAPQVELASVPQMDFADSHLVVLSGAAAGKSVPIAVINAKALGFALSADHRVINSLQPGDRVRIDNSWALALQTYQRHQVPTPDLYGWNQYRDSAGKPIHPQRERLLGPIAAAGAAGCVPNGRIHGKMLVLQTLMDIDALPWQADWYQLRVKRALGPRFDDNFALWYIDHAQHDTPRGTAAHAHTVSFEGALQQALHDLSTWVEKSVKPSNTQYEVIGSQVTVPASATQRKGVQPVVELQANGGVRADVAVNQPVTFTGTIEVPPNAGKVVAAEWDFEGVGNYPLAARLDTPQPQVRISATHSFSKPGTYFPVLRATSHRDGDSHTAYRRIHNIARARVVVK